MSRWPAVVLLAACATAPPPRVSSPESVSGTVVDGGTHRPIDQAMILLYPSGGGAPRVSMSAQDGFFAVRAQPGSYRLWISHEGYAVHVERQVEPGAPPRTFELTAGESSHSSGSEQTVTPPVLLGGPNPEYTAQAFNSLAQGWMVVWCAITVAGSVERCQILKGFSDDLNASVVRALERRRYKPATLNGAPIEVDYTFALHFQLQ